MGQTILLLFWVYIIACFINPKIFLIKNTPRWQLALWFVSGTFIIAFWAIYKELDGISTPIIFTILAAFLSYLPNLYRKSKAQPQKQNSQDLTAEIKEVTNEAKQVKIIKKICDIIMFFLNAIITGISYIQSNKLLEEIAQDKKMGKVIWRGRESKIVNINYLDSEGHETSRKIAIKMVTLDYNYNIFLHAFCITKKELRSFRVDRIKDIFTDNGEIIDKITLLNELGIKKPNSLNI